MTDDVKENSGKKWYLSFRQGLRYELFFRKAALPLLAELAQRDENPARQRIWADLHALEIDGMARMEPIRQKYHLNSDIGTCSKSLALITAKSLQKGGDKALTRVAESAGRFIESLKAIGAKAPDAEDAPFTAHMVAQEQLIKECLEACVAGEEARAEALIQQRFADLGIQQNPTTDAPEEQATASDA